MSDPRLMLEMQRAERLYIATACRFEIERLALARAKVQQSRNSGSVATFRMRKRDEAEAALKRAETDARATFWAVVNGELEP